MKLKLLCIKIEKFIKEFPFLLFVCLFLLLNFISAFTQYHLGREMIKNSEEYIKYNKCIDIQGKYYCK